MLQLAMGLGCLGIECHLCVCTCMHTHIYAHSCTCSHTSVGGESGSVSQKNFVEKALLGLSHERNRKLEQSRHGRC